MAPVPGLHLHPPWHPPAPAPGPGDQDGHGHGDNGGDDSNDDDNDLDDDDDDGDDNRDVCYATYPVQMLGSARSKSRTWLSEKLSSSSPS